MCSAVWQMPDPSLGRFTVGGQVLSQFLIPIHQETTMKWETPSACDFRFGFEITMYVANR